MTASFLVKQRKGTIRLSWRESWTLQNRLLRVQKNDRYAPIGQEYDSQEEEILGKEKKTKQKTQNKTKKHPVSDQTLINISVKKDRWWLFRKTSLNCSNFHRMCLKGRRMYTQGGRALCLEAGLGGGWEGKATELSSKTRPGSHLTQVISLYPSQP